MNQKIIFAIIPIVFALGAVTVFSFDNEFLELAGVDTHAKVMSGHLQVISTDENGVQTVLVDKHNLIVGEGLKTLWDLGFDDINLNGNATDAKFDTIRIGDGNTAPAVGDTGLQTAISGCSGIEDGTVTGGGTNSLTWAYISVQFAGTNCASTTVSEAVLTNDVSGGEVLARQTFADINLGSADTLTVNWNVTLADDGV